MNKGCMRKENSYPNTFATEQLSFYISYEIHHLDTIRAMLLLTKKHCQST